MIAKTDRFWELTATLGGTRRPAKCLWEKKTKSAPTACAALKPPICAASQRRNARGAAMTAMGT